MERCRCNAYVQRFFLPVDMQYEYVDGLGSLQTLPGAKKTQNSLPPPLRFPGKKK